MPRTKSGTEVQSQFYYYLASSACLRLCTAISHSAYGHELTHSVYCLLQNLKCHVDGVRHPDNESLKAIVGHLRERATQVTNTFLIFILMA